MQYKLSRILPLIGLCLLSSGCGGGNGVGSLISHSSTTLPNGLTLQSTEDTARVAVNGSVNFSATLSNNTTSPISMEVVTTESAPPYTLDSFSTIVVENSAGSRISPAGQAGWYPPGHIPNITTVQFLPGQALSTSAAYTFIKSGVYAENTVLLTGQNGVLSYGAYNTLAEDVQ